MPHGSETGGTRPVLIIQNDVGNRYSDIVLDLFETIGYEPGQVVYVWFDTGLEYEATKRHLVYLEERYGIEIQRHKAKVPIPLAVKKYGVPFLNKLASSKIEKLQKAGFNFVEETMESGMEKYPRCKSGLTWWCKPRKETRFSIGAFYGLKEFMILNNPPLISDRCCDVAKKQPAKKAIKELGAKMQATGVRRAEGGIRATQYSTCFTPGEVDQFRPIFFWSDADKAEYEVFRGIVHSDCYTVYGMKRTGCAGCPFNSKWEEELEVIKRYEPKLYKAACNIFVESYEYTRRYRAFKESWKREKRRGCQIDLFDNWEDLL